MAKRQPTPWDIHVKEYKAEHPDVTHKQALSLASKTYTRKTPVKSKSAMAKNRRRIKKGKAIQSELYKKYNEENNEEMLEKMTRDEYSNEGKLVTSVKKWKKNPLKYEHQGVDYKSKTLRPRKHIITAVEIKKAIKAHDPSIKGLSKLNRAQLLRKLRYVKKKFPVATTSTISSIEQDLNV